MSYRSESVATAVRRTNNQYFLPAIQREFVWKPEQICQLFDSLMRGYPISSFLFWEVAPENRTRWQTYRFIRDAHQSGTHNEIANIDGVHNLVLVLDGQQRLTALQIGLMGSYTIKQKHKRRGNPDAWIRQQLYLNVLADPATIDEDGADAGLHYRFKFLAGAPPVTQEACWIPVARILALDEEKAFEAFVDSVLEVLPPETTHARARIAEKTLQKLYNVIWKDESIAYYTEHDQDSDRVLDIFVRANEGGTKLSKSDLLLSMVTSSWSGINAREEMFRFVDHLNRDLTRRNDFDKDVLMKSCLVLCDMPVAYKVENFNQANLAVIRSKWPDIKSALERSVDLINSFGIDRDNLTSVNAIIPVAYYAMRNPGVTFQGTTEFEARNARNIRKWFIPALLNGSFGGSSDQLLTDLRAALHGYGAGEDFPEAALNAIIRSKGRVAGITDATIDEILNFEQGSREAFLALTLLFDDLNWGTIPHHQDHLFAAARAKREMPGVVTDWEDKIDRLANLTLLMGPENQGKQDNPLAAWLATRDPQFMARHLIPMDPALWETAAFDDFLAARAKLIRQRLHKVFA